MLAELVEVVIGVDTHKNTHSAAVVAATTGAVLAEVTVTADPAGYRKLLELAAHHSGLRAWALEGSASYGAGLARELGAREELVVELDRPVRPARRGGAKSDPIDAVRAARDALARTQLAAPRGGAERNALQIRLAARRAAVSAGTEAQNQLHALVVTSPEAVRGRFRGLRNRAMLATALRLRPAHAAGQVEVFAALSTLKAIAGRVRALEREAAEHERAIRAVVASWRPDLLALTGVGPIVAATVLTAWSHPGRCRSDAAFAKLAGVAPIPACSGEVERHRLSRAGDRRLNSALHTVVLSRRQHDQVTRDYVDRRRSEGKTSREINRCLKRYISRQLYRQLELPPATPPPLDEP